MSTRDGPPLNDEGFVLPPPDRAVKIGAMMVVGSLTANFFGLHLWSLLGIGVVFMIAGAILWVRKARARAGRSDEPPRDH